MKTSLVQNLRSSIIGSLLCLATSLAVVANVIHVPDNYSTIQAAVKAAVSGDEIQDMRWRNAERVFGLRR